MQAVQEGPADSVLAIAGGLSVQLARDLIGTSGGDLIQAERMEAMTTSSLPALRAYLEGEAAYRRSDFATAVGAYERAVAQDSLFALEVPALGRLWVAGEHRLGGGGRRVGPVHGASGPTPGPRADPGSGVGCHGKG